MPVACTTDDHMTVEIPDLEIETCVNPQTKALRNLGTEYNNPNLIELEFKRGRKGGGGSNKLSYGILYVLLSQSSTPGQHLNG